MAIVINGSGTVTGLAVGGLPDGTVDAGTLATDGVTGDKVADDAITPARTTTATDGQIEASKIVTTDGNSFINFPDNGKIRMGAGNDLQIYHDGSNSYITDAGTGDIHIRSDAGFRVQNAGGTENYIYAESNGKVRLYYDNNTKLDTTATGVEVTGTVTQSGAKTQIFVGQYDGSTTGTTTLGSLGFKPMALWCLFCVNNTSVGSWGIAARHGGQSVLFDNQVNVSSQRFASDSAYFGRLRFGSSNDVNLSISAWNDNEVVITRSKGGIGNGGAAAYKILVMG